MSPAPVLYYGGLDPSESKIEKQNQWQILAWCGINCERKIHSKLVKMIIFQTVQNKFLLLGISSYQSTRKALFSRRIMLVYFIYGCNCILGTTYFFHVAQSFEEYTNNIYTLSAGIMIFFFFTIVVRKMSNLFKYIENVGKITTRSELSSNSKFFIEFSFN